MINTKTWKLNTNNCFSDANWRSSTDETNPEETGRGVIRFIYKDGTLLEVILHIYPLKQSVRARNAGKKIPTGIQANAASFLMTAELLWLLVAVDPAACDPAQTPMLKKASRLAVKQARSNPRGDGQVAHGWLLKQYRRKLTKQRMEPARVSLFKLHSPRIYWCDYSACI